MLSDRSDVRRSIQALAEESLFCVDVAPRSGSPEDGITTALSIQSGGRADVLDLDRVFFMGDGGTADVSWLGLPATTSSYELLLHVTVTKPIECGFAVHIPVEAADAAESMRRLSYLLAADRLALAFDTPVNANSAVIIAAPVDRRALLAAIDSLRALAPASISARSHG
jgi:hypothetical protein